MPTCAACGSYIFEGASDCPKCGALTSSPSGDNDAKVIGHFKNTLGSLVWGGVFVLLACGALALAYYDFSAYLLGHSLRSPSPYRLDFVGVPALIAGLTKLLWVTAFLMLAFPRSRRYWLLSALFLIGGFLIDNYVALPLHYQETSQETHSK